jgi:hypothetical protein
MSVRHRDRGNRVKRLRDATAQEKRDRKERDRRTWVEKAAEREVNQADKGT